MFTVSFKIIGSERINVFDETVCFGIGSGGMTFDNFFEGYPGMVAFR